MNSRHRCVKAPRTDRDMAYPQTPRDTHHQQDDEKKDDEQGDDKHDDVIRRGLASGLTRRPVVGAEGSVDGSVGLLLEEPGLTQRRPYRRAGIEMLLCGGRGWKRSRTVAQYLRNPVRPVQLPAIDGLFGCPSHICTTKAQTWPRHTLPCVTGVGDDGSEMGQAWEEPNAARLRGKPRRVRGTYPRRLYVWCTDGALK